MSMSIEISLEGQLESEKDFEAYMKLVNEICTKKQVKMEVYEHFALIDVCPEGFIECSYEDGFLSISAQTNVAGPGFHAFVCSFFDDVIKVSPMELAVSDMTKYFEERSFDKLKHQIFYRWLQDIGSHIEEMKKEAQDLCISWPMEYYHPKARDGFVITPMGYIAMDDFKKMEIEELAEHFFVWNHMGRDARYYRNAAINLLWKECYYEYSNMNEYTEKMTATILDYVELAYQEDPSLPLPMSEYQYLCGLSGREIKIHDANAMYVHNIGYRRELVELQFGNWSLPAHGCSETSIDDSNQTLFIMAPYQHAEEPWTWMYKVNIYAFKQAVEGFLPEIENNAAAYDTFTFSHDTIQAKGYLEKKEDHILLSAQLNCEKEMMMLQIIICDEHKIPELMENIKHIKCRKVSDDQIKS